MKQHILVVDDEAPIRDLLSSYFAKQGYQVSTSTTAEEALKFIAENPLDLVVLDVMLGDTDGLQMLGMVRQTHPKLPVIIMTGIGFDEELLQEAIQKGATGYISKTLPLDQLLREVHRALKFQNREK